MAQEQAGTNLRDLCHRIGVHAGAGESDAALLERFASRRDEPAFAVLVRRHGPMVLRLCSRLLRHTEDAEDAFQATFLVLARSAGSIRKGEALGSWLYGVAHRVAMRASRAAARRRQVERQVRDMPTDNAITTTGLQELQAVLDEEVQRLPEKYRAPLVLCCLAGKSRDEAARELGWNKGTLSGRLAHARLLLRRRLTRRGITLTAALAAVAISPGTTHAVVPAGLAAVTLNAALSFAAGPAAPVAGGPIALAVAVQRSLSIGRLRRLGMLLAMLVLLPAGAGLAALKGWTATGEAPVAPAQPAAVHETVQTRTDLHGDPLPDGVVRRFGTVRLRRCGPILFLPDGKHIVTGGGADGSDVVFWDRRSGKELRRLQTGGRGLLRLVCSPDGKRLAAMTGTVFTNPLWDLESDKLRFRFKGETGTFTRDGRYLLGVYTGRDGRNVGRWDVETGKPAGEWALPEGAQTIACSPDGKTVAYMHRGGPVIYDLQRKAEVRRCEATQLHALAFDPDGRHLLAWGMGGLRLWEVETGKQVFAWDRLVDSATVSADGRRLGWTGSDERSIPHPWVLDLGKGPPRRLGLPVTNLGSHIAFSPDGGTLAFNSDSGAAELRDVATGKSALALDGNTGRIFGLELSPDGAYLATYDTYRALVWDTANGKLLRRLPGDGASPPPDQRPAVWDVRLAADGGLRRSQDRRPDGHWDSINVPFLPRLEKLRLKGDGSGPAFANFSGTIQDVLESADGHAIAVRMSAQRPGMFDRSAALTTGVWDQRSGLSLEHLRPPGDHLLGAFSTDNRLLVTTAPGGTIHVWEVASGTERLILRGHMTGHVRSILFTRDQRFLFSGGDDSQVLQWDVTGRARDGGWRPARHEAKEQQELWAQLTSVKPGLANKAIWELAADPAGTVAFLQTQVKPIGGPPAKEVADLIGRLDSDNFGTRQQAQASLAKLGESVVPALRQALATPLPLEQKRRLESLLRSLDPPALSGEALRSWRAVEVLEHIATPEARRLLSELAKGVPGARLTQAATESLQRLESGFDRRPGGG